MNLLLLAAFPVVSASLSARVMLQDDETAPRSASVSAAGARRIQVEAHAGSLRIEGRSGLNEVRATGTARASRRDDLEDIKLIAERNGDVVVVRADIPDSDWGNRWRALDMVIEVPDNLPLEVDDGSGGVEISAVSGLDLNDGSGEVDIRDVRGPLVVEDGSGELRIDKVRGDVTIRDGSGEITIADVQGSVLVEEDGSGSIETRGVTGNVRVRDDGSGSIRAEDVGGDFVVDRDGSGGVRHRNVRGTVRVP
ncbi:MAG: DUF4097 family beta strand repeat-containing protein, partial [Gemmatimonadaceae bacterium]